jgi:hypothetical protein
MRALFAAYLMTLRPLQQHQICTNAAFAGVRDKFDGWRRDRKLRDAGALAERNSAGERATPNDAVIAHMRMETLLGTQSKMR